jgi:PAS domain S-box-containing protein
MTDILIRDDAVTPRFIAAGTAEHYALIIEASPSGLMQVRADGTITLVNRRIETMFGYHRSDLLGRSVDLLVPARFREGHAALRRSFVADAANRQMGASRDIVALRKDGAELTVEIGLSPVTVDGQPCVIAAVVDVTEHHQARLELERQREDLLRANADLSEFAHAASHDLKAPMRGIAHLAQWISEDVAAVASPQTLENCALMQARAARMQALLDGLLAYARVGRTPAPVESFETATMARELIAGMVLPGGFAIALGGEMPRMTTERMPLERVLQNLIENAVKHHDRQTGNVLVSADREGKFVRFAVSDDGPGIPPKYHKRIFQIFQTLSRRDDVESSGVGLAIVKKKVEMHGGRIMVESAPPQRGTRFVFTWPDLARK